MSIFYRFRLVWGLRARRPGPFAPGSRRGYVGMTTDEGKPALSRPAGARSLRHERKHVGAGEPVCFFVRDYWTCPRNVRAVLTST